MLFSYCVTGKLGQGSHRLWKTWKMARKISMHKRIMKNREKIKEF